MFVKPLQAAAGSILSPRKLDEFISKVYSFQKLLHSHHFEHLSRLQKLQRENRCHIDRLVVPSGMHLFDWDKLYGSNGDYVKGMEEALAWLQEETENNEAFELFLHVRRTLSECPLVALNITEMCALSFARTRHFISMQRVTIYTNG